VGQSVSLMIINQINWKSQLSWSRRCLFASLHWKLLSLWLIFRFLVILLWLTNSDAIDEDCFRFPLVIKTFPVLNLYKIENIGDGLIHIRESTGHCFSVAFCHVTWDWLELTFYSVPDQSAGRVVLGSFMFARGKGLDHWTEMLSKQKEQVQYWHAVSEWIETHWLLLSSSYPLGNPPSSTSSTSSVVSTLSQSLDKSQNRSKYFPTSWRH